MQSRKDTPYIYCGCEVDKQGNEGICHIVKLDGRNGNRIWNLQIPCKRFTLGEKALDGGMYCTPLLGMGDCSHLLSPIFAETELMEREQDLANDSRRYSNR